MKVVALFSVASLLGAVALASACGESESKKDPGGTSSPRGGSSSGGSSSQEGGSANQDGGSSSQGGGSSSQEGGSNSGEGGDSTTGGASQGGSTSADEAGFCEERCPTAGADCGTLAYSCSDERKCECINDAFCQAEAYGFTQPGCTDSSDCSEDGHECVVLDSETFCTEVLPEEDICGLFESPTTFQLADESGDVTVCTSQMIGKQQCEQTTKSCTAYCESNGDCGQVPFNAYCNEITHTCGCEKDEDCGPDFQCTATGRCGCAADARCSFDPNGPVCNLETGECGCEADADCAEEGIGKCVQGKCATCDFEEGCGLTVGGTEGTQLECVAD